jgi:tetratricopeptide (TPR) repeat protein
VAETTSKDRNKQVKDQLLKKKDAAALRRAGLDPGEMVDDALARATASFIKWLRSHTGMLQAAVVGVVLVGAGYAYYENRMEKRDDEVSSALFRGVEDERGKISTTPKTEEEERQDPTRTWRSAEDRRNAALGAYRKAIASYPGSGAAILAQLNEAGMLFEQDQWDAALAALHAVKASALARADPSVRGRAADLEGLALEGKGDVDGALKAFREVQNTDLRGLKELGMYEQARLLYARGDSAEAKNLLISARDRLRPKTGETSGGGEERLLPFLSSEVDALLGQIDPAAVAQNRAGGKSLSAADLARLQEQFKRSMKHAQEKAENQKDHEPTPAGSAPPASSAESP